MTLEIPLNGCHTILLLLAEGNNLPVGVNQLIQINTKVCAGEDTCITGSSAVCQRRNPRILAEAVIQGEGGAQKPSPTCTPRPQHGFLQSRVRELPEVKEGETEKTGCWSSYQVPQRRNT
ncbi:hypothetical protein NQZ68_010106 [Dissostichus eleginoides]|nr:hypothetical protein NQZ68_010106 [Dissostichus eleginoides]